MTRLHQLHERYGQNPWLDNLTRGDRTSGRLQRRRRPVPARRLRLPARHRLAG
ncbi:MAG TPA: hypothetical protein VJ140_13890 [Actinomycetota bacterium]|nr:hypothetical protein [Actinomycetota bacterium]